MPLTEKGREIKGAMEHQYGKEKGEQVFYASKNKGTISGVDEAIPPAPPAGPRFTAPAPGTVKTDLQRVKSQAPQTEGMSNFYAEQIAAQDRVPAGPPFETATQAESGTYPGRDATVGSLPGGTPKETPTSPSSLPESITPGQTAAMAMSRSNANRP